LTIDLINSESAFSILIIIPMIYIYNITSNNGRIKRQAKQLRWYAEWKCWVRICSER